MSGFRSTTAGVVILVAAAGVGTTARAQAEVPGGWDAQVDYQTFRTPAYRGGFGTPGYGGGLNGGIAPALLAGATTQPGLSYSAWQNGRPQVVNGLGAFADVVRKSGRRRSKR